MLLMFGNFTSSIDLGRLNYFCFSASLVKLLEGQAIQGCQAQYFWFIVSCFNILLKPDVLYEKESSRSTENQHNINQETDFRKSSCSESANLCQKKKKKRMSQLDLLITALCFSVCCEKYSITRNLRRYHYEEPLR